MPVGKLCTVCGKPSGAKPRCPRHLQEQSQAREARRAPKRVGYKARHKTLRATWAPIVAEGHVTCRRQEQCRYWPDALIKPGQKWHVGEPDAECSRPTGPEHELCNTSAAGRWKG